MAPNVIVIGSGFAGLSAACHLAKAGCQVTVLEKNATPGGRARQFEAEGFRFDMGPSWYWMPDVFEQFFGHFGKKPSDYYTLKRLDPSYRIFFGKGEVMDLPASLERIFELFESIEPGSRGKLKKFLDHARFKYETGMQKFVYKPAHSPMEFLRWTIFKSSLKMQLFKSLSSEVRSLFHDSRLIRLLEFPVLFLGATPQNTPAMYSMMNYADMVLGTWYPEGGMVKIVEAMVRLAQELGVRFEYNADVVRIGVEDKKAKQMYTADGRIFQADVVLGSGDYHHLEQHLLEPRYRQYDEAYWSKRVMAPSSLIFYLGVRGRLNHLKHHSLFFDADFRMHSEEIYTTKQWPANPLFYVSVPSVSDASVAPDQHENLFILIPVAADLNDTPEIREKYFTLVMERLESLTGQDIRSRIVYQRSYAIDDFKTDYHSFRGNAYGLANTLNQTAFLKPKMKSKKVENLYYAGQLTVPGPGIPPALISGHIAAREILKKYA